MTTNDLNQIGELMDKKLIASEKRVIGEIGKFMADNVFPLFEEVAGKSDIERLERRIDHLADQNNILATRVTRIESIPAIAHELKVKKS